MDSLTPPQMAVVKEGVMKEDLPASIARKVWKIGPASQEAIDEAVEAEQLIRQKRGQAKAEGADLVRRFLAGAQEGLDVEDMAALLEQALYRDILRRYADEADEVNAMPLDKLIGYELNLRKIRLARDKEGRLAAQKSIERHAARLVNAVFARLCELIGPAASATLTPHKESLLRWAKEKYGPESFHRLDQERSELERLNDYCREEEGAVDRGEGEAARDVGALYGYVG